MNDRKQQIQEILEKYTNKYTSAQFAERLAEVEYETEAAQAWFEQKRKELKITDEEIKPILEKLCQKAKENQTAFMHNIKVEK